MKKTLIALTIAGLGLVAGCSGNQVKGLNGTSVKPYSNQVENLNGVSVKNNFMGIPLEKGHFGGYIGSREKEDGSHEVASCKPYGGNVSMTKTMATMDARSELMKLQNGEQCTQEGNTTTCKSSGTLYGSRVTRTNAKKIGGKNYLCVRVE